MFSSRIIAIGLAILASYLIVDHLSVKKPKSGECYMQWIDKDWPVEMIEYDKVVSVVGDDVKYVYTFPFLKDDETPWVGHWFTMANDKDLKNTSDNYRYFMRHHKSIKCPW
jgi:hypothetical protein